MRGAVLAVCFVVGGAGSGWADGPTKEFRTAFEKVVQRPKREAERRTYGVVVREGLLSTSAIGRRPIPGRDPSTYSVQLVDGEIRDTVERPDADARKLSSPFVPGEVVVVNDIVYKDREVRVVLEAATPRRVPRPNQSGWETFLAEVRIVVPDAATGADAVAAFDQLGKYVKFTVDGKEGFGQFVRQQSQALKRK
jgi:hypothetical protein